MRVADFFLQVHEMPVIDLDSLTEGGGLVIVAPHPDDESLGCGGVIAEACSRGMTVRLLILSDGVGSHPNSKNYPPSRLSGLRKLETIAAASELGLDKDCIRFIDLPDRFVPTIGQDAQLANIEIASAVRSSGARVVLVTWEHDPHCDHVAANTLVRDAIANIAGVRMLAYPVWGWTLPSDDQVHALPTGVRIDVSRHIQAKSRAIAAHRSQTTDLISDDPTGFRLSTTMIDRFLGRYEVFLTDGSIAA